MQEADSRESRLIRATGNGDKNIPPCGQEIFKKNIRGSLLGESGAGVRIWNWERECWGMVRETKRGKGGKWDYGTGCGANIDHHGPTYRTSDKLESSGIDDGTGEGSRRPAGAGAGAGAGGPVGPGA